MGEVGICEIGVYLGYMKKRYILIILVVFGVMFWALTRAVPTSAPVVISPAEGIPVAPTMAQKLGVIEVSYPLPETTISASPMTITGKAKGNWFFEATAPVSIVNWDGLIIGQGYIKVDQGYDWMTTDMVPFTGTISYDASQIGMYKYGWVIVKKDNPSDDPKFDDSLEFKILFP